jgi:hypothetical protein
MAFLRILTRLSHVFEVSEPGTSELGFEEAQNVGGRGPAIYQSSRGLEDV